MEAGVEPPAGAEGVGPFAGQDGDAVTLRQISARLEKEMRTNVALRVEDTGLGCDGPPPAGFGLSQVRERLQAAFGERGRVDWASAAGQGTRITLTLPLQP